MNDEPMFRGELAFLSNYEPTPFYLPALDVTVRSGEHAFNALKTLVPAERQHVLDAPTPGSAKQRGRHITLRPGWDTGGRVLAMQRVLRAKFATGSELAARLDATGEITLIETNTWHDQFWGRCLCPKHAGAPGQNILGELLMAIRAMNRAVHV